MNMRAKRIIETVAEVNPDAVWPTGFENAIVGWGYSAGSNPIFIMDAKIIINILKKRDHMKNDEAVEYFDYNIAGCYMADGPVYLFKE